MLLDKQQIRCNNFIPPTENTMYLILQHTYCLRELREAPKVNKYKTKLCQKYWVTGYCAYGPRCNFIHQEPPGAAGGGGGGCDQQQQQMQRHRFERDMFPSQGLNSVDFQPTFQQDF